MILILTILYAIGAATLQAHRDAAQIGGKKWHAWAWRSRAYNALAVIAATQMYDKSSILDLTMIALIAGAVFWLWFDALLNGLRDLGINYLGENTLDRLLAWIWNLATLVNVRAVRLLLWIILSPILIKLVIITGLIWLRQTIIL